MNIEAIQLHINEIVESKSTTSEKLQHICDYLKQEVAHYDWVGFYFANHQTKTLSLAQFTGHPTEHTEIPFGKGICGQVAESNANFVVQDVNEQGNYISCGWQVKSEIVIPIFKDNINIGQIDIDSHTLNPFTKNDEILLEGICNTLSNIL